ncbi:MAG: uroporphyrinogen decarboxylase family protein [Victivallaceae bacterium]
MGNNISDAPAVQVMKAIRFETPDYLPRWDNYWGSFAARWRKHNGLTDNADPGYYYGCGVSIQLGDESLLPSAKGLVKSGNGFELVNDGWGRVVKMQDGAVFSETTDRILKDPPELDKLIPEPADLPARYKGFVENVESERKAGRCVFGKIGGIYCRGQFVRGEENLLMDMLLDKKFCNDFFDLMAEHLTGMALQTLSRGNLWDTGLFVYDDMAGSKTPNFSPDLFEEFFLPRYKKMIARIKQAGCAHVFFHSDGNIVPLLDLLLEAGFEGFNPLEPACGLNLVKLREKYGRRMIFFGGVCNKYILPGGNKKEIEAHVRPLIDLGRDGGLIIGQASIGDDISPETYDYYMSLVSKYGNYS